MPSFNENSTTNGKVESFSSEQAWALLGDYFLSLIQENKISETISLEAKNEK